jgi:hypothetical protein
MDAYNKWSACSKDNVNMKMSENKTPKPPIAKGADKVHAKADLMKDAKNPSAGVKIDSAAWAKAASTVDVV